MDQAPDAVHKPQSVLRYSGTKEKEGAQQELVLSWRWTRPPLWALWPLVLDLSGTMLLHACVFVGARQYVCACVCAALTALLCVHRCKCV